MNDKFLVNKMSPEQIESLLNDIGELPTLPSIATAIMEKTLEDNVSARQIAEMVEKDQALSLKVLKVANSPFYRRIKEISTIRGAVVLLGFNVLKSIVLSISVLNLFNAKGRNALDFYKFWQHSIACAVCAKAISSKVLPSSAEDAFIAGLLHDLGKVIADQLICKKGEYQEVLEAMNRAGTDIIEVENEVVGIDHASIGKYLMEKWNLPAHLSKTVGYHHSLVDITDDPTTKKLCSIIHVADMVTNHLGLGVCEIQTGFVDPALLNQLGLTSHDVQDISITLKDSISTISEQLGIPKAEPKTYFEVLQSANAQLGKLSMDLEQKKMALENRALELTKLHQMSSHLQASMKLSDITNILSSHTITILDAKKARSMIRLNNMRIMVTESFRVGDTTQTRTGMASATKELLNRTNGIFPRILGNIFAPLRVDNKIIGALEVILQEETGPDEINQKTLMLRTISEVGAQAIERAMLVTKNIKAQRLAAVSKTAIAANHEINSPLTTMLLKLDMLAREANLSMNTKKSLDDIKNEAITIRNVVKKMLEISDVVETSYANNEKMLDLNKSSKQQAGEVYHPAPSEQNIQDIPGFEEYTEDKAGAHAKKARDSNAPSIDAVPGFEDYVEDKATSQASPKGKTDQPTSSDTPGFEDYLDE
jgi:two-component system, cell cycle response regulator